MVEARHFSEFAAWSLTNLAGMRINEYCPICRKCTDWEKEQSAIVKAVRDSAYHIIEYKGATYFAIGLALVRIAGAILRNQRKELEALSQSASVLRGAIAELRQGD